MEQRQTSSLSESSCTLWSRVNSHSTIQRFLTNTSIFLLLVNSKNTSEWLRVKIYLLSLKIFSWEWFTSTQCSDQASIKSLSIHSWKKSLTGNRPELKSLNWCWRKTKRMTKPLRIWQPLPDPPRNLMTQLATALSIPLPLSNQPSQERHSLPEERDSETRRSKFKILLRTLIVRPNKWTTPRLLLTLRKLTSMVLTPRRKTLRRLISRDRDFLLFLDTCLGGWLVI